MIDIPDLEGKVHRDAAVAIDRLKNHFASLLQEHEALTAQLAQRPGSLTLAQIQDNLSATGSHPLTVAGLIGT